MEKEEDDKFEEYLTEGMNYDQMAILLSRSKPALMSRKSAIPKLQSIKYLPKIKVKGCPVSKDQYESTDNQCANSTSVVCVDHENILKLIKDINDFVTLNSDYQLKIVDGKIKVFQYIEIK